MVADVLMLFLILLRSIWVWSDKEREGKGKRGGGVKRFYISRLNLGTKNVVKFRADRMF